MMTAAPLGPLAEVILEQYGEQIEAAIAKVAAQRARRVFLGHIAAPIQPCIERFRIDELATRHIQPGNWVAVGRVHDETTSTIVEFNLSTWESREVAEPFDIRDSLIAPPNKSAVVSATERQAAS
jgi:hypothetical protein